MRKKGRYAGERVKGNKREVYIRNDLLLGREG